MFFMLVVGSVVKGLGSACFDSTVRVPGRAAHGLCTCVRGKLLDHIHLGNVSFNLTRTRYLAACTGVIRTCFTS